MVIKALDPDWIRIRIGLQPQTLDSDPKKNLYGSETLLHWFGFILQE